MLHAVIGSNLSNIDGICCYEIDPNSDQMQINPRFYASIQFDFIGAVMSQLSCLSVKSIKFHIKNRDFRQLLLTGNIESTYKNSAYYCSWGEEKLLTRQHEQILLDIEKKEAQETFFAGCLFKFHHSYEIENVKQITVKNREIANLNSSLTTESSENQSKGR